MQVLKPLKHVYTEQTSLNYQIYGLHIQSNVEFPQLPAQAPGTADMTFCLEEPTSWKGLPLPQSPAGPVTGFLTFRSSSHYVYRWPEFYDFSVRIDGRSVTCYLRPGAPKEYVRLALFGRTLSLALHLQGVPNLHGSAVAHQGGSVAFVAPQGGGKSTLAAFCAVTGSPLVSEEVLALREEGDRVYVSPGYPQVRLTSESLEWLTQETRLPVRTEQDDVKVRVALEDGLFCGEALPLETIYLLTPYETAARRDVWTTELSYQEALPELLKNTLNIDQMDRELTIRHVAFLGRLVQRLSVRRLHFPRGLHYLPEVRDVALGAAIPARAA